jgi:intracellular septation protein
MPMNEKPQLSPFPKLALELGPLVLFFAANARWDIFVGTGVFMAAVLVAIVVSYTLTRHLPIMAIVSAVIVMVFGGLTIALQDKTFIMIKPTIIYVLFAAVLLGGLALRKPLLLLLFDQVFNLTEEGWRKLTLRWALFFLFQAVLNEIIRRTQSEAFWIGFKAFGVIPLNIAFAMLQYPLLVKYDSGAKREDQDVGAKPVSPDA